MLPPLDIVDEDPESWVQSPLVQRESGNVQGGATKPATQLPQGEYKAG